MPKENTSDLSTSTQTTDSSSPMPIAPVLPPVISSAPPSDQRTLPPENPYLEDAVTFRVIKSSMQYLLVPIGLITGVLAIFGLKFLWDLTETKKIIEAEKVAIQAMKQKAQQDIDAAKKGIETEKKTIEDIRGQLNNKLTEAGNLITGVKDDVKKTGDDLGKINAQTVTIALGLAQSLGNSQNAYETAKKSLDTDKANIDKRISDVNLLISTLQTLDTNLKLDNTKFKADLNTKYEQSKLDLQNEYGPQIKSLQGRADTLEGELFGSGSYVLEEKNSKTISTVRKQDLIIQTGAFEGTTLYNVVISDEQRHTLKGPMTLSVGEVVEFTNGQYSYKLTPRYIFEIRFNPDISGIDVSWKALENNDKPATINK